MATSAEQTLAEITERLSVFTPELEGLHDYARLNLQDPTMREVLVSIELYERRVSFLKAAQAALLALMADGHPDMVARQISPAALADLQNNLDTISAARLKFGSNSATNLTMVSGAVEDK